MDQCPASQKQERFEQAVIDDMDECAEETAYNEIRSVHLQADKRQPDADEDNTDILDAAVGQQAFQVALTGCQGNAVYCRPCAKQENKPAKPNRLCVKKRQCSQNAINPHLQHHAGHHG